MGAFGILCHDLNQSNHLSSLAAVRSDQHDAGTLRVVADGHTYTVSGPWALFGHLIFTFGIIQHVRQRNDATHTRFINELSTTTANGHFRLNNRPLVDIGHNGRNHSSKPPPRSHLPPLTYDSHIFLHHSVQTLTTQTSPSPPHKPLSSPQPASSTDGASCPRQPPRQTSSSKSTPRPTCNGSPSARATECATPTSL